MKFAITGLNHRSAPVTVREQLAFAEAGLPMALAELRSRPGVQEGLVLSTCNRVEVAVAADDASNPRDCVEQFLALSRKVDPAMVRPYLYHYEGKEAVRHLFRVAASLDSMVVGEPQILGQLKNAYQVAKDAGTVNSYLDTLLSRAFSVAKRVRTETEIGSSAVSISYAAVELAREIFGSLKNQTVLLVGAGKMSELAARHLRRAGVGRVLVTNRTEARALEMARLFNGDVVPYDRFKSHLFEADIVITSSGAPHFILLKEDLRRALDHRKSRPMFVIDIAVPRNVEPAVNELEHVFLYDVDDLQRVVESNLKVRQSEAEQADAIIAEEMERLETYLRSREAVPVIVGLQERLEELRLAEVARLRGKFGTLTPQQEELLEQLTRGLVNKIAHGPITELRKSAGDGVAIDLVRRMFRLEERK